MKYDIVVIGGGPAGLMAAITAGELGSKVVLLEKNSQLGVKLLATGGGRCNLTNRKSARELAANFGPSGRWLLSALSKFGPVELIEFFNGWGLKTKVEAEGRVFPRSNLAQEVRQVLVEALKSAGVDVKLGVEVKRIVATENQIQKVILSDGREVRAHSFIICTGGKAYPLTGSTGDGYKWLKQLGHKIVAPRPALTPIIIKDKFVKSLEGLSLIEAEVSCYLEGKKIGAAIGPVLFTGNGLSGPTILNLSTLLSQADSKNWQIRINFFPNLDFSQLDKKLQLIFSGSNQMIKNALGELVPPKLVETLLTLAKINLEKKLNLISREERKTLVHLLHELELSVWGLAGYDRAMVTAGGVDLKEVEARTMRSKIVANLYLAGEILDLNGPTGGYNLQLCWTTGYVAGRSAER
jgi:hypothetical protein